jgi:hypothetical protein
MSLLRQLPLPEIAGATDAELGEVATGVDALLLTDTWEDAFSVVRRSPALLSKLAHTVFDVLAELGGANAIVEARRAFLGSCRERGVDVVWREYRYETIVKPIMSELDSEESRDPGIRLALCTVALEAMEREVEPDAWALLQYELGANLLQTNDGGSAHGIEEAIQAFEGALTVLAPDASPLEWSLSTNGLGIAYRIRVHGDRLENLEKAIACHTRTALGRGEEDRPSREDCMVQLGKDYLARCTLQQPSMVPRRIWHTSRLPNGPWRR